MKTYKVNAVWMNGKDGVYAGPYRQKLGEIQVEGTIETEEIISKVETLFNQWRTENPHSDGWRTRAWPELI